MKRKYKNPPIIEAVFECRFPTNTDWDLTIPGLLYRSLKDEFPRREKRTIQGIEIQFSPDPMKPNINFEVLAVFRSEDRSRFVQVGQNVITVNIIKPYPNWEIFSPMISNTLASLGELIQIETVERAGLRYINKFEISKEQISLKDYFKFGMNKGDNMPESLIEFIVGGLFLIPETNDSCRIQLASGSNDHGIVLDLDYFTSNKEKLKFDDINSWVDHAHSKIIEFFEDSITDKSREFLGVIND